MTAEASAAAAVVVAVAVVAVRDLEVLAAARALSLPASRCLGWVWGQVWGSAVVGVRWFRWFLI